VNGLPLMVISLYFTYFSALLRNYILKTIWFSVPNAGKPAYFHRKVLSKLRKHKSENHFGFSIDKGCLIFLLTRQPKYKADFTIKQQLNCAVIVFSSAICLLIAY